MSNYLVQANKRGWIFASLDDARNAANDVFRRTGKIVGIVETDKSPTHVYSGRG